MGHVHHNPGTKRRSTSSRFSALSHIVVVFVAFLALVAIELSQEAKAHPERSGGSDASVFSSAYWYRRVLAPGHSGMQRATQVALVIIGADEPKEVLTDACCRRKYLANLLRALSDASPKAVAIDLWFEPDSCSDKDSTAALRNAMLAVARHEIPVVYGLGTYSAEELQTAAPVRYAEVSALGFDPSQVILRPTVDFDFPEDAKIKAGLVTLNADNRKIPLQWPAYPDFKSVGVKDTPKPMVTLAVAAAMAANPAPEFQHEMESRSVQPFAHFQPEECFPVLSATQVIADPQRTAYQLACASAPERTPQANALKGHVALLGLVDPNDPSDLHDSVIGEVQGLVLQANYIESLLDGQVYSPAPLWLQLLIGAVFFLFIVMLSLHFYERPLLALICCCAATFVLYLVIHELALLAHYYTETLIPFIIASVILVGLHQIERLTERRNEFS